MKLTLVRPGMGQMGNVPYVEEGYMEPLQLGILAAACPPDVAVTLVEDRHEKIPFDEPTDLVAITVEAFTARRSYEIAAEYRQRGVKVVLGGVHPTMIPDEAAERADAIALGDAEAFWPEIVEDARRGRLRKTYGPQKTEVQGRLLPRRALFRNKGYLPITLMQFGRGCPHGCVFCTISSYFKQSYAHRPVADVVKEIEQQDRRMIFFVDDNMVADPSAAKALFRALIPLRIHWVSQGSIDMAHDRELLDLMSASGCVGNVIGFESFNPETLRWARKTPNLGSADTYEKEVETIKSYGFQTWASFTLGYDDDTPSDLYRRLDFAMAHKFTFAAFNVLVPYAGTPLYDRFKAEGRLLYDGRWWVHPEFRVFHAPFRPARMSAEELTAIGMDIRAKWNSKTSMLKRFFDPKTNMSSLFRMGIYWAYNPLFRRQAFWKQSMPLGSGAQN
jgi:radical SAM superfamily enzyme YgiQ (UPF0313 family)